MKRLLMMFFCVVLLGAGCARKSYRHTEGRVYGTTYHVCYESDTDYNAEIRLEMERVNASLSMFNKHSLMARVNRGETDQVDSLFIRMYARAKEIHEETNGAFDITIAPLVNAWGFGYEKERLPSSAKVDSLLRFVGMEKTRLAGDRIVKEVDGMQMDASSIAKGLGVDLTAEFLESQGINHYMVEIGGEVRVRGHSEKERPWHIGIDKPIDDETASQRELQFVLAIDRGAVATSGNYRRFYIAGGKKYAHTINPKTGYPVQKDIVGASVYAPTCMEADAYATAFMVLGMEEAKKITETNPRVEACLVYENERGERETWVSEKLKTFIWKK